MEKKRSDLRDVGQEVSRANEIIKEASRLAKALKDQVFQLNNALKHAGP